MMAVATASPPMASLVAGLVLAERPPPVDGDDVEDVVVEDAIQGMVGDVFDAVEGAVTCRNLDAINFSRSLWQNVVWRVPKPNL
jgi:hypothetical protein